MAIWERPVDVNQPQLLVKPLWLQFVLFTAYIAGYVLALRLHWHPFVRWFFNASILSTMFNLGYTAFRRAQARGWI